MESTIGPLACLALVVLELLLGIKPQLRSEWPLLRYGVVRSIRVRSKLRMWCGVFQFEAFFCHSYRTLSGHQVDRSRYLKIQKPNHLGCWYSPYKSLHYGQVICMILALHSVMNLATCIKTSWSMMKFQWSRATRRRCGLSACNPLRGRLLA